MTESPKAMYPTAHKPRKPLTAGKFAADSVSPTEENLSRPCGRLAAEWTKQVLGMADRIM